MAKDFSKRSLQLERIDTGDYTAEEYNTFLREIRFINRMTGDTRALSNSLFRDVSDEKLSEFSVLDVGAGSGELLRLTANFARRKKIRSDLCGLELNAPSAKMILDESRGFPEINSVRGDAFSLPFADGAFDFAICSLFTHHFKDDAAIAILRELNRVSRRRFYVIDLHRHRMASILYDIFCATFRISRLVREDGSLSIRRGFVPGELSKLANEAGLKDFDVVRSFPFRLVLRGR